MLFEGWSVRLLRTTNGGNQTAAGLPGQWANSPLGTNDPSLEPCTNSINTTTQSTFALYKGYCYFQALRRPVFYSSKLWDNSDILGDAGVSIGIAVGGMRGRRMIGLFDSCGFKRDNRALALWMVTTSTHSKVFPFANHNLWNVEISKVQPWYRRAS